MQNCSDQFLDVTVEDINTNESDEVNDDEDIKPSDVDEYVFVKKSTTVKSGKTKGKEKCVVSLVSCNSTFKLLPKMGFVFFPVTDVKNLV